MKFLGLCPLNEEADNRARSLNQTALGSTSYHFIFPIPSLVLVICTPCTVSSRALTVAHIGSHDPSPAPYPPSPKSCHQLRRQQKKSSKGKGHQTRKTTLSPSRPCMPPPHPSTSHATPHSSDRSTPRGCTGQPLPSPPSPTLLHPTSLPPSHHPMASSSSHHTASHCRSPRPTSAPATAPAIGLAYPAWAQFLFFIFYFY